MNKSNMKKLKDSIENAWLTCFIILIMAVSCSDDNVGQEPVEVPNENHSTDFGRCKKWCLW